MRFRLDVLKDLPRIICQAIDEELGSSTSLDSTRNCDGEPVRPRCCAMISEAKNILSQTNVEL